LQRGDDPTAQWHRPVLVLAHSLRGNFRLEVATLSLNFRHLQLVRNVALAIVPPVPVVHEGPFVIIELGFLNANQG